MGTVPGAPNFLCVPFLEAMSEAPPRSPVIPLPLHVAPRSADGTDLVVRRKPGRPKVVRPQPAADEEAYNEQVNLARNRHIEADAVVGAVAGRSEAVLHEVLVALAREAAGLKWEREQGQRQGRDVAQLASRRIDALHKAALVLLGQRRVGINEVDPKSEMMARTIKFFVDTVDEALAGTLSAPRVDALTDQIGERLLEWAATADAI